MADSLAGTREVAPPIERRTLRRAGLSFAGSLAVGVPQLYAKWQNVMGETVEEASRHTYLIRESGSHITIGNLVGLSLIAMAGKMNLLQEKAAAATSAFMVSVGFNVGLEAVRDQGLQGDWLADTGATAVATLLTVVYVGSVPAQTIPPQQSVIMKAENASV